MTFVKWIRCEVDTRQRDAFSAAQRAWSAIASSAGLEAQLGGWDASGDACILALWRDRAAYERFFAGVHDTITDGNAQRATYVRSSVTLAQELVKMRGDAPTLTDAAAAARVLRVADCRVAPERRAEFVAAQKSIWEPGMAAVDGHEGGLFSGVEGADDRFLVTTLWADAAAHDRYRRDVLPTLTERARPADQLHSLSGHVVQLEPQWTVLPHAPDVTDP